MVKMLMILTSHAGVGDKPTGWFLPELAHPFFKFQEAGYEIEIVSIDGGEAPVASSSLDMTDAENKKFWETPEFKDLTVNTKKLSDTDVASFDHVFYVGGFGTMFDFAFNADVQKAGADIYKKGGCVGAVCHGPIALAYITVDGVSLIAGKKVAGFCNEEEDAVGLWDILPEHPEGAGKSCEQVLLAKGAIYEKAGAWGVKVCSDNRVITGQNPMSAAGTAEAMIAAISA